MCDEWQALTFITNRFRVVPSLVVAHYSDDFRMFSLNAPDRSRKSNGRYAFYLTHTFVGYLVPQEKYGKLFNIMDKNRLGVVSYHQLFQLVFDAEAAAQVRLVFPR